MSYRTSYGGIAMSEGKKNNLFVQWIINSVYGKKKDAPLKSSSVRIRFWLGASFFFP